MSAIAEHAGSCIGSLYQYFPNKLSVAEALRAQYVSDVEDRWNALARDAEELSAEDLIDRLVGLQVEIVRSHPVLLALLDVPPTSHSPARRRMIRDRITRALLAHRRRMSNGAATRTAAVVQQVSRALLTLYAQAGADEKAAVMEELKAILSAYLLPKLHLHARSVRSPARRRGVA